MEDKNFDNSPTTPQGQNGGIGNNIGGNNPAVGTKLPLGYNDPVPIIHPKVIDGNSNENVKSIPKSINNLFKGIRKGVARLINGSNILSTRTDASNNNLDLEGNPNGARESLKSKGRIKKIMDLYNKQPTHVKVAISLTLLGSSLVVPATGGAALVLLGVKTGLRVAGSYAAGEVVETALRNRLEKKLQEGEKLSAKTEVMLYSARALTALTTFFIGEWADSANLHRGIDTVFDHFSGGHEVATQAQASVTPLTAPVLVESPVVTQVALTAPLSDVVSTAVSESSIHTSLISPHEWIVRAGNTLSNILLHDGINQMFEPKDIAKLSWQAKQNLIENVTSNLTPNQLREIGISSGKAGLLKIGETIDISKLAAMAKNLEVLVGGERVPLLKRALELSQMR